MPRRPRPLPADIAELVRRHHDVLCLADARAAGVDPRRLYRLRDAGLLTVVAPGCFVLTATLRASDELAVFRLRARAFAA